MSDSIKEVIVTDLQKVKAEGGTRVARIRDIFKEAAVQAMTEVKHGSGEVGTIAKESFANVIETIVDPLTPADQATANADPEVIQDATTPEPEAPTRDSQALLNKLFLAIRQQLASQLNDRWTRLDGQLSERYGDRYAALKQRWHHFVAGYQTAKATATEQGVDPVQAKQTEIADRAGNMGVTVAQTEQQLRQQLKDFLAATAAKI